MLAWHRVLMLPPCRQTPTAAPLLPTTVNLSLQVDTKQGADPNWLKQVAEKYNKLSGPFQGSGQKLGGGHDSCFCLGDGHAEQWSLSRDLPGKQSKYGRCPSRCACDTSNTEQRMLLWCAGHSRGGLLEGGDGRSH